MNSDYLAMFYFFFIFIHVIKSLGKNAELILKRNCYMQRDISVTYLKHGKGVFIELICYARDLESWFLYDSYIKIQNCQVTKNLMSIHNLVCPSY